MSRQGCPISLVASRFRPHGHRRPVGLWSRTGLFVALLLALTLAFARGGVDVTATDVSLLTVKPREIVTRVLRVTNRTGATGTFESRLVLPEGWRAVTPDFPFQLAPGVTAMRLVSFFAPEHTAAGEYRVGYQVLNQASRGVAGGTAFLIRVLPVFKLQVDILDLAPVAIANEPYPAVFQISNYSNAALTVGFAVESSRGSTVKPAVGTLTLAAGESRPVELVVRPPAVTEPVGDEISLTVSAPGQGLSETAKRRVETLPRVGAQADLYHSIPTLFTRRLGMSWGKAGGGPDARWSAGWNREGLHGNFQLEWSGGGPIDGTGERSLRFLFRGPDLNEATIFGQESWFAIDYQGKEFDWALGNVVFGLSPLTEAGAGGVGARLGWHRDQWRALAWHTQDWGADEGWGSGNTGDQTGLSIQHAVRPNWWVGANYLQVQDDAEGDSQVLSLRQQIQLQPDLALDLEVAGSTGDQGNGMAYWLDLVKLGAPWRYRLNLLYADPNYAGQYQDQNRAHLDLGYTPKNKPWSLWGFYRYDQYNQDQEFYRYQSADRYLYRNQERLVVEPARTEENAGVGASWRVAEGSRYLAELRYGECRNSRDDGALFDDVTHALRLGYGRTFKEQNLSLDASVELGRRFDHLTGETVPAQGYRGSLFWRPSRRLTLGAYVNDSIDPCQGDAAGDSEWPTLGLSAGLYFNEKSSFSLNVQGQQSAGQTQLIANAQYSYRRDNGDIIGVQAQAASGINADINLMLSYTVPIQVATMRRTDVATLRGQVFDQESGKGLSNIVLKMERLVAITDERGNFSFPSVPRGVYELQVAGGKLPVGMIPVVPMPVEVDLLNEGEVPVKLPYIRGATIGGVIQVYEPDASLLPSQTFVQVGRGGPPKPLPAAALELKPTHGLGGILVEVKSGEQVYRRLTNGNGEFRFAGLQPGTWTVKIDPAALPDNATIDETSVTLVVKPSAEETVEFKVEQRIRSMRMLPTLKVSG
jgi:hypothetical protein